MTCKNEECVKHFEEVHGGSCILTGKNKCQDYLHLKTCFSAGDLKVMRKIFNNIISE